MFTLSIVCMVSAIALWAISLVIGHKAKKLFPPAAPGQYLKLCESIEGRWRLVRVFIPLLVHISLFLQMVLAVENGGFFWW